MSFQAPSVNKSRHLWNSRRWVVWLLCNRFTLITPPRNGKTCVEIEKSRAWYHQAFSPHWAPQTQLRSQGENLPEIRIQSTATSGAERAVECPSFLVYLVGNFVKIQNATGKHAIVRADDYRRKTARTPPNERGGLLAWSTSMRGTARKLPTPPHRVAAPRQHAWRHGWLHTSVLLSFPESLDVIVSSTTDNHDSLGRVGPDQYAEVLREGQVRELWVNLNNYPTMSITSLEFWLVKSRHVTQWRHNSQEKTLGMSSMTSVSEITQFVVDNKLQMERFSSTTEGK